MHSCGNARCLCVHLTANTICFLGFQLLHILLNKYIVHQLFLSSELICVLGPQGILVVRELERTLDYSSISFSFWSPWLLRRLQFCSRNNDSMGFCFFTAVPFVRLCTCSLNIIRKITVHLL